MAGRRCTACGCEVAKPGEVKCKRCNAGDELREAMTQTSPVIEYRRRTGVPFAELARRTGLSGRTIESYAYGTQIPGRRTLPILARVMGVDELKLYAQFAKMRKARENQNHARNETGKGGGRLVGAWGKASSRAAWSKARHDLDLAKKGENGSQS